MSRVGLYGGGTGSNRRGAVTPILAWEAFSVKCP